jgi:hypothetical protein
MRPTLSLTRYLGLSLAFLACNPAKNTQDTGVVDTDDEDTGEADEPVDADGDGFAEDEDCDDESDLVHPDADEICDGLDNDCDGLVDDADDGVTGASTWYVDDDEDGYGDPELPTTACVQPSRAVSDDTDCDDAVAATHPAAEEVCDQIDNDCDGDVDEDVTSLWFADTDGDGFGDVESTTEACDEPLGFTDNGADCDDDDAAVHPDAAEVCDPPGLSVDDDCDGFIDDADPEGASDASTWYADGDTDGYGDATDSTIACVAPSGAVADATDCDDTETAIHPAATEVCDGVDNDCDTLIDDDDTSLSGATTWYADLDGDGYGDASDTVTSCEAPTSYGADDTDCDDTDGTIHPGADEVCGGTDEDCDGLTDEDEDVLGDDADCAAISCDDILDARGTASDGAYTIEVGGAAVDVLCDMSTDGGGWTMAANFAYPGSTAGVSGWTSGDAVGSDFTDNTQSFKLSDTDINALVTEVYRASGQATQCNTGACSVDLTLFWDASCSYASGTSSSGACAVAYDDLAMTAATGNASPCSWHYGLTSVACGGYSEMGTSHSGEHVFVGIRGATDHAYDGRSGEDPSVQVWIR